MKKTIHSREAPSPIGPYSQAIQVNGMLYVSGQIPIDQSSGSIITGDIKKETEQVMNNISYILKEAGIGFSQVVKCTIFVTDMSDFGSVNEVYGRYFSKNPPARETVEVSGLPKGVNIEIACIATV